jgi:hypothetical protein
MAEYQMITATLGSLVGICPDCDGMIYRRASRAKLSEIQENLEIFFRKRSDK